MKAHSYNEVDGWRRYQPLLPTHLRAVEGHLPTEEYVDVGDCSVHVDRWPVPDAPLTVIALHGGGGHGRMLAPLCRMVTSAGFEAVAPDLPLYGATQVPDPAEVSYRMSSSARGLSEVVVTAIKCSP